MSEPLFDIPCVILCGGKSSRMGEDKSLLPFDKFDTLSEYQYIRLKPYFKEIYLSSKVDKFNFPSNIIYDKSEIFSPLVALKSILSSFETPVFILSVDTPFVDIEIIKKLYTNIADNDAVIAEASRRHFLCGIYHPRILNIIDKLISDDIHKIGFLLKSIKTQYIKFEDENNFMNINTPSEYKSSLTLNYN